MPHRPMPVVYGLEAAINLLGCLKADVYKRSCIAYHGLLKLKIEK